jgi:hypothetical protein
VVISSTEVSTSLRTSLVLGASFFFASLAALVWMLDDVTCCLAVVPCTPVQHDDEA